MVINVIDVPQHPMKLSHCPVHHSRRELAPRVGDYSHLLEFSGVAEPVCHCANSATVLGPYVHLAIYTESGYSLPRTSVLHARFHWIAGKARAADGIFQS